MPRARRAARWTGLGLGLGLGLGAGGCTEPPASAARGASPLVVERGPLAPRLLLTGELEAVESDELLAPQTDNWAISIRWMAEDGALVKAGDRVVELDNTAILEEISDHELAVIQAGIELSSQRATSAVEVADKRFEVETQRIALAKAEVDAAVSPELVSRREHMQLQLAVKKARTALATAEDDLKAAIEAGRLAEEVKRIALDKARRKLEGAQEQIEALVLRAPRDGVVEIGEQPWEGRKLQVGDTVWPGMTVAKLPDLSTMVVQAQLSDVDDGTVAVGMAARCLIDAQPERPLEAVVTSISPVAREPEHQSMRRFFSVVLSLSNADPEIMRPGLSVKAEIRVDEREALLIPRAGLDLEGDEPRARLASGETVEVTLGACDARSCELLAGVDEGTELSAVPEVAG